jgi:hypothetical protein
MTRLEASPYLHNDAAGVPHGGRQKFTLAECLEPS